MEETGLGSARASSKIKKDRGIKIGLKKREREGKKKEYEERIGKTVPDGR